MSILADGRTTRPRGSRWVTLLAGWTLLVVGGAMLVLPGPGLPAVLGGLALLGREHEWARRLRARVEARVRLATSRASARWRRQPDEPRPSA